MKIHHIGYAVKNIDKARDIFANLGFSFSELVNDTSRNLYIQFGKNDSYRIELLAKLDESKESPIDSFIKKIGPTPYHFCYLTKNIEEDIKCFKNKGFIQTTIPCEAIAFDNKRVVFLYNNAIGLIELVED